MKAALLIGVLAVSFAGTASVCGSAASEHQRAPSGETTVALSAPGALSPPGVDAPPPAPRAYPPFATSGHAVYTRDDALYIGALDGSGEQMLTRASLCSPDCPGSLVWLGEATVDAAAWLYYGRTAALRGPAGTYPNVATVELLRRPSAGGAEEALGTFTAEPSLVAQSAGITADGRYLAYAGADGVHLRSMEGGEDRRLLPNSALCTSPKGCYRYVSVSWSPDGQWLYLDEYFWEGGQGVLLRPFDADPHPIELDSLGSYGAAWSPDGSALCLAESGYPSPGSAGYITFPDLAYHEVLRTLAGASQPQGVYRGCGWPQGFGWFAVEYRDLAAPGPPRIALIMTRGAGATMPAPSMPAPDDGSALVAVLPGGSGVIVSGAVGDERPHSEIVLLGGDLRRLSVDADTVLATLP